MHNMPRSWGITAFANCRAGRLHFWNNGEVRGRHYSVFTIDNKLWYNENHSTYSLVIKHSSGHLFSHPLGRDNSWKLATYISSSELLERTLRFRWSSVYAFFAWHNSRWKGFWKIIMWIAENLLPSLIFLSAREWSWDRSQVRVNSSKCFQFFNKWKFIPCEDYSQLFATNKHFEVRTETVKVLMTFK